MLKRHTHLEVTLLLYSSLTKGRIWLFPWLGGEGNGTPLQYSCLENPMDRGAWKVAVHRIAEGQTRLSDFTFTFHFHTLENEMATHCSVLAWRIPGMGEHGGLPSMGLHRVGHDWSNLAAAADCVCEPWFVDLFPISLVSPTIQCCPHNRSSNSLWNKHFLKLIKPKIRFHMHCSEPLISDRHTQSHNSCSWLMEGGKKQWQLGETSTYFLIVVLFLDTCLSNLLHRSLFSSIQFRKNPFTLAEKRL